MINNSKFSIKYMMELAQLKEGKCLSEDYINSKTKLKWQCKEGHIWETVPSVIINGSWCPYCAGKHQTIDNMKKLAEKKGGKCLSDKYVSATYKLKWECKKGHVWEATPINIKIGQWCPYCVGKHKKIEDMQTIAQEKDGFCLSKNYQDNKTKLKWQCKEGHIWEAIPSNIIRGQWCPICSAGIGERICRIFFEQIFKNKFPRSYPKWLLNKEKNQMELDRYCENLKLAFEHQGEQHYRQVKYFQSKSDFYKRLRDDKEKERLCKENNIFLIKIPEINSYVKISELKKYIINECKKIKFNEIPNDIENIEINLKEAYTPNYIEEFNYIKNITKEKQGICLSEYYLGFHNKLKFQCIKGHIWDATPANISRDKWCPYCVGKYQTIDDMKKLAEKKGGKCLSKKYINNITKLKWQCMEGHIWETAPANIKNGKWCPECYENRRGNSLKLNITLMQQIARKRNGKCLSDKYINARTKLKWECLNGHVWEATPDSIKRGSWCPFCLKKY